jgi:hypothetical protein
MKQTAVEFIFDAVYRDIPFSELLGIIAQAKEMEKQQIFDAYNQGCLDTLKDGMKRGEQYYNETF